MVLSLHKCCAAILFAGFFCATSAFAQEALRSEPFYATLDSQAAQGGSSAVMKVIEQGSAAASRHITLQWLKDRVLVQRDPDPFYSLFYSDLLFTSAQAFDKADRKEQALGLYQTSFLSLNVFEAMALTDAARCADKTVMGPITQLVSGRYAYFRDLMARMPSDLPSTAKKVALEYEAKQSKRPPFRPICNSGMASIQHALKDPTRIETTVAGNDMIGAKKIMVAPSKPYEPKFVPDETWNVLREQIRQKIQSR